MPARSRNRGLIAVVVLVVIGAALYLAAGGLMEWLRVTMHGR